MMGSRFSVDITSVSGSDTMKSHGDYDTVDRIHFKNDKMEMIVLPEGTWMRTGKDWTQPPVDMGGMVKQFIPKSIEDMRAATKSATDDGMSSWNGQTVHVYSYVVDTTMMGIHVTSTNKIYVNAAGQIVHAQSDGEAMGRKSHTTQDVHYDSSIRSWRRRDAFFLPSLARVALGRAEEQRRFSPAGAYIPLSRLRERVG